MMKMVKMVKIIMMMMMIVWIIGARTYDRVEFELHPPLPTQLLQLLIDLYDDMIMVMMILIIVMMMIIIVMMMMMMMNDSVAMITSGRSTICAYLPYLPYLLPPLHIGVPVDISHGAGKHCMGRRLIQSL